MRGQRGVMSVRRSYRVMAVIGELWQCDGRYGSVRELWIYGSERGSYGSERGVMAVREMSYGSEM